MILKAEYSLFLPVIIIFGSDMNEQDLLWGIDDPSVVTKLQHPEHRWEYAVGQKESQPLKRWIIVHHTFKVYIWKKDNVHILKKIVQLKVLKPLLFIAKIVQNSTVPNSVRVAGSYLIFVISFRGRCEKKNIKKN